VPIDGDTRLGIASGTKLFTALGIARLVESGRIAFDTPVTQVLPAEFPQLDRAVTIHHLLTHTSGFFDYYDEEENPDFDNFYVDIPWYRLETPGDYLPLLQNGEMVEKPGERFRYNNGGFVLLGVVIEAVSGETYRGYVEREVLGRSGMENSGFFAFNQLPENTAQGYIELPDGQWKTNIYNLPVRGGGDGGMYTTATDLDRFWAALASGAIVSDETVRIICEPKVRVNETTRYGYGIYLGGKTSAPARFILGGDAGVGFDSRYFPEPDVVISVLSNVTDGESIVRAQIYSPDDGGGV